MKIHVSFDIEAERLEDLGAFLNGPEEKTAELPLPKPAPKKEEKTAELPAQEEPDSGKDAAGTPWDARIHSSNKTKTSGGCWKKRKGVSNEYKREIERELRGEGQPQAPAAPAAPAAPQPQAPAAPAAPQPQAPLTIQTLWNEYLRVTDNNAKTDVVQAINSALGVGNFIDLAQSPDRYEEAMAVLRENG